MNRFRTGLVDRRRAVLRRLVRCQWRAVRVSQCGWQLVFACPDAQGLRLARGVDLFRFRTRFRFVIKSPRIHGSNRIACRRRLRSVRKYACQSAKMIEHIDPLMLAPVRHPTGNAVPNGGGAETSRDVQTLSPDRHAMIRKGSSRCQPVIENRTAPTCTVCTPRASRTTPGERDAQTRQNATKERDHENIVHHMAYFRVDPTRVDAGNKQIHGLVLVPRLRRATLTWCYFCVNII